MQRKLSKRGHQGAREYIVEVIDTDGIRHHLGPFRRRKEAQRWIALHGNPPVRPRKEVDAPGPLLSLVQ